MKNVRRRNQTRELNWCLVICSKQLRFHNSLVELILVSTYLIMFTSCISRFTSLIFGNKANMKLYFVKISLCSASAILFNRTWKPLCRTFILSQPSLPGSSPFESKKKMG